MHTAGSCWEATEGKERIEALATQDLVVLLRHLSYLGGCSRLVLLGNIDLWLQIPCRAEILCVATLGCDETAFSLMCCTIAMPHDPPLARVREFNTAAHAVVQRGRVRPTPIFIDEGRAAAFHDHIALINTAIAARS
jgi:hypothetical protein